jgi:hypothetical protein
MPCSTLSLSISAVTIHAAAIRRLITSRFLLSNPTILLHADSCWSTAPSTISNGSSHHLFCCSEFLLSSFRPLSNLLRVVCCPFSQQLIGPHPTILSASTPCVCGCYSLATGWVLLAAVGWSYYFNPLPTTTGCTLGGDTISLLMRMLVDCLCLCGYKSLNSRLPQTTYHLARDHTATLSTYTLNAIFMLLLSQSLHRTDLYDGHTVLYDSPPFFFTPQL